MNPRILERIALHADIDTRRALGFAPRKVVLPFLDLPMNSKEYTDLTQGRCRCIKLRNARLYIERSDISWQIGTDDFKTCRSYSFNRDDGRVSFYALLVMTHSQHPDFHEDGSFKRSRPFLVNE